ncbi:hypothetical protein HYV22_00875 [Candidatus Gottesmanbacteria bacterium]|nr:hypothetical protein [Candidatus Gottesmanbacteria bacterium]
MLTQKDINTLIDRLKLIFPTKDEVKEIVHQAIDERFRLFPTKEEYFSRMDALSGELKAVRESQELHAHDHVRINDRLDRVEHHLALPPLD